ncbi:MAG: hypothetical protein ACREXU_03390 [Gammaproteobacteria bacterium]
MTPAQLLSAWRLEVDDTATPSLWSDSEAYTYMDQAQRAFARATDCFLDATTASVTQVTVTATQNLATLSTLVTKVRRAELASNNHPVAPTTLAAMDEGQVIDRDYGLVVPWQWRTATGEPRFAVTDYQPGKLLLVPKPVAGDTLNLVVYRLPLLTLALGSGAFEVVDEDHQYGLRLYMQHLAFSKVDSETYSPRRAAAAKTEWLEFIGGARLTFRRQRFTQKPVAYGGI